MSFWRTYYHLVWATKDLSPIITPDNEERLHHYLVQKAAELGIYLYAIGSDRNHAHVVTAIPPKLAVAHAVKHLKGASSYYLNVDMGKEYFAWQRGYGVLTLGEGQRGKAIHYVKHQKELHAQGKTNAWLEHYAAVDEGPADQGIVFDDVPVMFREETVSYNALGEPPF